MKNREYHLNMKKKSKVGLIISLLAAAVFFFTGKFAEKQLMILDQGKLDEVVLE